MSKKGTELYLATIFPELESIPWEKVRGQYRT